MRCTCGSAPWVTCCGTENMPPILKRALRNRWFVVSVHVALWILLYLGLTQFGGEVPDLREANAVTSPPQSPAPVAGLEHLFLPGIWPKTLVQTNMVNPFFTTNFILPPPPPPSTRNVQVAYQGYHQFNAAAKIAYLKVDDLIMEAPIGTRITNDTFIKDITLWTLTLTNGAGQTNLVQYNTNKVITIPIQ
jgi:hypothetical protein